MPGTAKIWVGNDGPTNTLQLLHCRKRGASNGNKGVNDGTTKLVSITRNRRPVNAQRKHALQWYISYTQGPQPHTPTIPPVLPFRVLYSQLLSFAFPLS